MMGGSVNWEVVHAKKKGVSGREHEMGKCKRKTSGRIVYMIDMKIDDYCLIHDRVEG